MTGEGSAVGDPDVANRRAPHSDALQTSSPGTLVADRAVRQRKLHIGHFAFMRAVLQGLDTRDSWDRYLRIEGEHDDLRNINRTITWIRDAFAAAAARHARHGVARLVRIDPRRFRDQQRPLPTLEEFAQAHGLDDFAQHEQIEQYQARYGKVTPQQSRRERLIARQLDAVDWLERLIMQPPRAGDALASWLHPDLAAHLERAGISTIRQLVDRINGLGLRWWRGIRAIGAGKAARVMEWLAAHEATIGLSIGAHAKVKRSTLCAAELDAVVAPATAIVPFEKLLVPPALDGSAGLLRAPQRLCLLQADNDYDAVLAWLASKRPLAAPEQAAMQRRRGIDPSAPLAWLRCLSNTQRAYLKEAERFMLWAVVERDKPLSSMTREDCQAYRAFVANPTPAARWCGRRGRERWGPLWRPFEGPLSPSAQRQALVVLKALYNFLVGQRYLVANPWDGVPVPAAASVRGSRGGSFTPAQWRLIGRQLDALPPTSANRRLRFVLHLLCATSLRLSEVVAARVDDLRWLPRQSAGHADAPLMQWKLNVNGNTGAARLLPVPPAVIAQLSGYLESRGLHPQPQHPLNHGAYLIGKAVDVADRAPWSPQAVLQPEPKDGIGAGRLYKVLKAFFAECAPVLAATDAQGAERMAAASTHWLRQVHGAQADAAMPLDMHG